MRNTVQKLAVLFLGTILSASLFSPAVLASSADVGIEPAYPTADNERTQSIFIMRLKPEEQGKNGIRLINSGKDAHTVEIYPTDSSSSVDGSFSCRQHAEAVKDVGTWVKLDKTKLTLQAGEQTVVDFTVNVPKGAGPGEHDGCIAVQDIENLPAKSGSGVLLGFRSAIRLAVTVPGKIVKKLDIVKIDIKHVENRGISVSAIAKNSGNVSLDVTARAQLVSVLGQETKIKSDAKYPIMQGATTGWPYVFDGPYWGGIYKARTSLSYNADPNAGLGQNESNQQRIRKDSGWFVAYPHPLAAAAELLVFVAIIWLLATPLRRRLQRRRVIKRWQKYVVAEGETLATIAKARNVKWKKIAKHNRIKAPYLIEAGRTIMVPKPGKAKKASRRPKAVGSELDWLSSEESLAPVVPSAPSPAPVPVPVQATIPAAERHVSPPEPPQPQSDWYPPQNDAPSHDSSRSPIPPSSAVRPVAPNPLFPEPEDTDFPDWREGASEDELRQLGVIADSASISQIQDSWSIDEEDTKKPPKKSSTKRRSPAGTKRPAVKKASTGRSTKKK